LPVTVPILRIRSAVVRYAVIHTKILHEIAPDVERRWSVTCWYSSVAWWSNKTESTTYVREMKSFPKRVQQILPATLLKGLTVFWASLPIVVPIAILSGCHSSTASVVEASTTRDPVVAPAGTVLRVRLSQTLETGRSRPGDRFSGVLDTAVMAGGREILPKGTVVEGHLEPATGGAALALRLDAYESEGVRFALETNIVARTRGPRSVPGGRVLVPKQSIIGFTLLCMLTT
jgi:hypothetical protein